MSEHADSEVDDDEPDLADGRDDATTGRGGTGTTVVDEPDNKQGDSTTGRDELEHQQERSELDKQAVRGRKRPADHVTSSPSVDDDEDEGEDYVEFGLSVNSPSRRHHEVMDNAAGSPPMSTRPDSLEQTEIKIQRPLGLLAQHGITTKTPGSFQTRTAVHRDLEQTSKDRQQQHQPSLAGGLDFSGSPLSLMDRRFMPSPPAPSTPLGCLDACKPTATSPGAHHWTFEEQFKQVSAFSVYTFLITFHAVAYLRGGGIGRWPPEIFWRLNVVSKGA